MQLYGKHKKVLNNVDPGIEMTVIITFFLKILHTLKKAMDV